MKLRLDVENPMVNIERNLSYTERLAIQEKLMEIRNKRTSSLFEMWFAIDYLHGQTKK